mmetsp:Transcript_12789/g.10927  ORF Transcript_12789/g.10927 Transcript_12789/m.10927 type:complete len:101 (-) Transcript_12789:233-535(-)
MQRSFVIKCLSFPLYLFFNFLQLLINLIVYNFFHNHFFTECLNRLPLRIDLIANFLKQRARIPFIPKTSFNHLFEFLPIMISSIDYIELLIDPPFPQQPR